MKNVLIAVPFVVVFALVGCAGEGDSHEPAASTESSAAQHPADGGVVEATAEIRPTEGNSLTGAASFRSQGGSVVMTLALQNAPVGEHAFHLHQIGDCSAPDGTSAGGHWNPTGEEHGAWGSAPFHLGDVGNLVVGEDGSGSIELTTDLWSIGTGEDSDIVGRAVIVHAGADDFTTQPTGAAGGRIGCGVIE